MARKILSDLISGVRSGIAWGLAMSPPGRLTLLLLEPLAAKPAPRPPSLPPCSDVVAPVESETKPIVDVIRDGAALLLFFLWHCEMRIRTELHEWKHALHTGYAWGQVFTGWGL
jgi:hypothetical protein